MDEIFHFVPLPFGQEQENQERSHQAEERDHDQEGAVELLVEVRDHVVEVAVEEGSHAKNGTAAEVQELIEEEHLGEPQEGPALVGEDLAQEEGRHFHEDDFEEEQGDGQSIDPAVGEDIVAEAVVADPREPVDLGWSGVWDNIGACIDLLLELGQPWEQFKHVHRLEVKEGSFDHLPHLGEERLEGQQDVEQRQVEEVGEALEEEPDPDQLRGGL